MPRYRDDDYDYDPDADLDRDPDEKYRRRVDRYGEDLTDEEEEEQEKEQEASAAAAFRKSLWPGLLMVVTAVLTLLGTTGFVMILATSAAPGPGAAVGLISLGICAGIPLLFTLVFCVLQLIGGICMIRRRARGMAMTGGILGGLAVIPVVVVGLMGNFPASAWLAILPALLGIPAGIWMFVAVNDLDVQEAFDWHRKYD